jgi:4-amino-4-deoxy-L-arabinose transferase-like glycosyltransferase
MDADDGTEPAGPDGEPPLPYEPVVPTGNPLRRRGLVPLVLGALLAFGVMASSASPRVGVAVSLLGVVLAAVGVLDLLGTFDDDGGPLGGRARLAELALPLVALGGAVGAFVVLVRLAVAGRLPIWASASTIPASFLAAVLALYWAGRRLGAWRVDEEGRPRPLHRRHGFWVVAIVTLVYLPMLGNHALIDPWETHYGEVAREILARADWVSLWWAQEAWFWSKPVLIFWIQAVPMALLGVRYEPGAMLTAAGSGLHPQPEWAVRLPIFLLTLAAHYLLYKAVARSHGRRAGLLAALVLLSMPQWFFVAHQTMTDMPFAATLVCGVSLFLLAIHTDPERLAPSYELSLGRLRLRLSLRHLVLGALLLVVLPQVLYLFSRNVSLVTEGGLRLLFHGDRFTSGSPGNCGLPGNEACKLGLLPAVKSLQPFIQALIWIQALALVLWLSWGERRLQRILFLAAWLFVSLSTMAKGPAGLGLPVLAVLAYVAATRRWRELARMEIVAGALIFACTVLPWFVAMYGRHGQPFTDRLLFHDMFKRAFDHVHDTNQGDDTSFRYYVWQLGYATFPWSGLVPFALGAWLRDRRALSHPRNATALVLLAWFVLGFALFALMGTKFHHYCLPIVPAAGALTGILLDDLLCSARHRPRAADPATGLALATERALLGAVAVGAALGTFFVGRDLAWQLKGRLGPIRLVHLFSYNYSRPWPDSLAFTAALWAFALAATLVIALLMVPRMRGAVVTSLVAIATVFAAWGLDVYFVRVSPHWGQRELFMLYEQERRAEPGPIIAYQLNWKGENFYRGNAIPAFVQSGQKFKDWVKEQQDGGVKVMYFVTEHGRTNGLAGELGNPADFELLTDKTLNNKFVLVRVVFG